MEWITNTCDLLCSYVCLSMMVAGVVCAAVRWFHICEPFRQNPSHFYPARATVTVYFLSQLLFIPFLLRPSDPHTILYAKTLPLISVTTFVPLCLYRFFDLRKFDFHSLRSLIFILPLTLLGLIGISLVFSPGNFIVDATLPFLIFFGGCALVLTAVMLKLMIWISRRIERSNMDNCSNEEDFPVKFASKIRLGAWGMTLLYWGVFLAPGRLLLCVSWLTFTVFSVVYTIIILNPQRGKLAEIIHGSEPAATPSEISGEGEADRETKDDPTALGKFSEQMRCKVIALIHKNYLDPHVTRRDIISQLDYGQRTEAGYVISHYGFYEMVNSVRLEHARLYAQEHPKETLESVAINSGFKDRFAMRHASKKIPHPHPDLLATFTPLANY